MLQNCHTTVTGLSHVCQAVAVRWVTWGGELGHAFVRSAHSLTPYWAEIAGSKGHGGPAAAVAAESTVRQG